MSDWYVLQDMLLFTTNKLLTFPPIDKYLMVMQLQSHFEEETGWQNAFTNWILFFIKCISLFQSSLSNFSFKNIIHYDSLWFYSEKYVYIIFIFFQSSSCQDKAEDIREKYFFSWIHKWTCSSIKIRWIKEQWVKVKATFKESTGKQIKCSSETFWDISVYKIRWNKELWVKVKTTINPI